MGLSQVHRMRAPQEMNNMYICKQIYLFAHTIQLLLLMINVRINFRQLVTFQPLL